MPLPALLNTVLCIWISTTFVTLVPALNISIPVLLGLLKDFLPNTNPWSTAGSHQPGTPSLEVFALSMLVLYKTTEGESYSLVSGSLYHCLAI